MFTTPVEAVSDTRVFARFGDPGRQYLAYEMSFSALGDTAMVLPLPVASRDERSGLRFIDLSATPDFFDRLGRLVWIIEEHYSSGDLLSGGADPVPQPLLVHEVGAFEASFVPSVADFGRLDPRFRLAPEVWQRLPQYHDYGFAVFKLRATGDQATHAHPMALEFSSRFHDRLFVPTVHVHDGTVPNQAWFDHVLYVQVDAWDPGPSACFENGLRKEEGAADAGLARWSALRPGGDWRLPRASADRERLGIVVPGGSKHRGFWLDDEIVRRWRKLPRGQRDIVLRLCRHAQESQDHCRRFASAIWSAAAATSEERREFAAIDPWMRVACAVQIEAETVRRWHALEAANRELALRHQPVAGESDAARAWRALSADQRERFGRVRRWEEVLPVLATHRQSILEWMDGRSTPRRERARAERAGAFFPGYARVPDALARAADGADDEKYAAIREAVLELEPDADEDARACWRQTRFPDWMDMAKFAELDELWPLFDATRPLQVLGLSGVLPNRDTLVDAANGRL